MIDKRIGYFLILALFAGALAAGPLFTPAPAFAAGPSDSSDDDDDDENQDPKYRDGVRAIKAKNYRLGIMMMEDVVTTNPNHADAWTYLGFALRKNHHFSQSEKAYTTALAIDPNNKNALEYMGELYLQTGKLNKAKTLRNKLASLCPQGCEQLDQLNRALTQYAANGNTMPAEFDAQPRW